jgi:hypothetical protein
MDNESKSNPQLANKNSLLNHVNNFIKYGNLEKPTSTKIIKEKKQLNIIAKIVIKAAPFPNQRPKKLEIKKPNKGKKIMLI